MIIKEKKTSEYPTRNAAYVNHGIWIEQTHIADQNDFECAVYYEPYENLVYSGIMDAIYIEIIFLKNGIYRVNGYAVQPDADRHEVKLSEWCHSYQEAKTAALAWLEEAKEFIITAKECPEGDHAPLEWDDRLFAKCYS